MSEPIERIELCSRVKMSDEDRELLLKVAEIKKKIGKDGNEEEIIKNSGLKMVYLIHIAKDRADDEELINIYDEKFIEVKNGRQLILNIYEDKEIEMEIVNQFVEIGKNTDITAISFKSFGGEVYISFEYKLRYEEFNPQTEKSVAVVEGPDEDCYIIDSNGERTEINNIIDEELEVLIAEDDMEAKGVQNNSIEWIMKMFARSLAVKYLKENDLLILNAIPKTFTTINEEGHRKIYEDLQGLFLESVEDIRSKYDLKEKKNVLVVNDIVTKTTDDLEKRAKEVVEWYEDKLKEEEEDDSPEVKFKDKGFEEAIKRTIHKFNGNLTEKDLLKIDKGFLISYFDADNTMSIPWQADSDAFNMKFPNLLWNVNESENGKWIEDLKLFNHIITLHLNVGVEDLSFLKHFKNLRELYLINYKKAEDFDFISELINLKFLSMQNYKMKNLNPIAELYKKQKAILEKKKEEGIKQALGVNILSNLLITGSGVKDLTPLKEVDNLTELNLSCNEIEDLTPLENNHYYYLTLRWCKIKDITPLENMRGMYYLNLRHNKIEDITVLKKFEDYYIGRLFLKYNPIEDYSPIENLNLVRSDVDEYLKENWRR